MRRVGKKHLSKMNLCLTQESEVDVHSYTTSSIYATKIHVLKEYIKNVYIRIISVRKLYKEIRKRYIEKK